MSEGERARQNATPALPSILHRSDVARKSSSFSSSNRNKVASKAARKTFAEPDSNDDSDPTRRQVTSGRPEFLSKTGSVGGDPRHRVSFSFDTRMLPDGPRKDVPSRPPAIPSSRPSQRRASFPSKSTNQGTSRRDPFASGIRSSLFRPSAPSSEPRTSQQYHAGKQISNTPAVQPSRFQNMPRISSGANPFALQSISTGRRLSPPAKSVPLQTIEALEDSTWLKTSQSTRKTATTMQSTAPKMIASSASSSSARRTGRGTHLRPDSDGTSPSAFIGRNMRVYLDGEEESHSGSGSDIEIVSGVGVTSKLRRLGISSRLATQFGKKSQSRQKSKVTLDEDRLDTTTGESSDETASVISLTASSDTGSPSSSSADSNPVTEEMERPASPSPELVAALEAINLSLLRMQETQQLPFLKRNLRRGFKLRCSQVNNNMPKQDHGAGGPILQLVYRLKTDECDSNTYEYRSRHNSWSCPLCNLHGDMRSRQFLQTHLLWDHNELLPEWSRISENEHWTVTLFVPVPKSTTTPENGTLPSHHPIVGPQTSPTASPSQTEQDGPPSLSLGTSSKLSVESPVHFKLKNQPPSPPRPVTRHTSQTLTSRSRSRSSTLATSREPSMLPPIHDPLGPTAQFPFLPAGEVEFSCRPGGERLYDLLNTLPLEPFGILAWYIIDREEEMFENDDVLDEDKVMQALWGRWILLNHPKFLTSYFDGTKSFIDEYWEMIHRAAGWAALRAWLLMFLVNRFLTGTEVAALLRHYESLTKMDEWYDDGLDD